MLAAAVAAAAAVAYLALGAGPASASPTTGAAQHAAATAGAARRRVPRHDAGKHRPGVAAGLRELSGPPVVDTLTLIAAYGPGPVPNPPPGIAIFLRRAPALVIVGHRPGAAGSVRQRHSAPPRARPGHRHRSRGAHRDAHRPGGRARRVRARRHHRARPYRFYDSVTPSAIPPGRIVATYANGGYAVPASRVAGRKRVIWIDVQATDPAANALDVEPGDATPQQAGPWAARRLRGHRHALAIIYTMRSWWPAARASVARLPAGLRARVRWWIADPTGRPHIVPGSNATQWYWGRRYDISTARPGF